MTVQLDMFTVPLSKPQRQSEQQRQIERVAGRIAPAILAFLTANGVGAEFHADDLHRYVKNCAGVAPASADRILRLLRQEGVIDYIVDRSASLYHITAIRERKANGGPGWIPKEAAE